jgi:hypothetical protein
MADFILDPEAFPFFKPNDPYYYEVDNIPLEYLLENQRRLQAQIELFPSFESVATKQWVEDTFITAVDYNERVLTDLMDVRRSNILSTGDFLSFDNSYSPPQWTNSKKHGIPLSDMSSVLLSNVREGDFLVSDGNYWRNKTFGSLPFEILDFADVRAELWDRGKGDYEAGGHPAGSPSDLRGVLLYDRPSNEFVVRCPWPNDYRVMLAVMSFPDPNPLWPGYDYDPVETAHFQITAAHPMPTANDPVATAQFVLGNSVSWATAAAEHARLRNLCEAPAPANPDFVVTHPGQSITKDVLLVADGLNINSVPQDIVLKMGFNVVDRTGEGANVYNYPSSFNTTFAHVLSTHANDAWDDQLFHVDKRTVSTFPKSGVHYRNEHFRTSSTGNVGLCFLSIGSRDKV